MDAIIEYDGEKYLCAVCGNELDLIKERGERTLDTDYKIDQHGNLDYQCDIDWDMPLCSGRYFCGNCGAHLIISEEGTEMDENLVEDILKHNAGVCENEDLL